MPGKTSPEDGDCSRDDRTEEGVIEVHKITHDTGAPVYPLLTQDHGDISNEIERQ